MGGRPTPTVGVEADLIRSDDGATVRAILERHRVDIRPIDGPGDLPLALTSCDALVARRLPVRAPDLPREGLRLRHIARYGVGLDHLDLDALTGAGILVTTTPDATGTTVASAAVTLMLALAHGLPAKQAALRRGGFARRFEMRAPGLGGRTLAVVGCGSIGREVLRLTAPWGMTRLAVARSASDAEIAQLDARRVTLAEALRRADMLVLCVPLTDETRHLIDAAALAAMKPGAHVINVSRGAVIAEPALIATLKSGHLGGAGLDVLDPEPPDPANPLLSMENVIATPHNLGATDEMQRLARASVAEAVVRVLQGERPAHCVNAVVFEHARWA